MCFSPIVSFLVFMLEVILACYILTKNPKNSLNQLAAAIMALLGFYQLSEFMLCISGNPLLWAKIGHLAYTFLPALSVSWVYCLIKSKKSQLFYYALPAFFSALAILKSDFIASAQCMDCFISIGYNWPWAWFWLYHIYYFGFILLAAIILIKSIAKEKSKGRRNLYWIGLLGFLVFSLPAFLLLIVFRNLAIIFPSLYCEFALIFTIIAFFTIRQSERIK